ncbi:MAG: trypsin-like peptidase domain-containing protein [bacterium]
MIAKDKIITNAHVVLDDNDNLINNYEICRTISSQSKPVCFTTAQVLYYDKTADLAILKLQSTK